MYCSSKGIIAKWTNQKKKAIQSVTAPSSLKSTFTVLLDIDFPAGIFHVVLSHLNIFLHFMMCGTCLVLNQPGKYSMTPGKKPHTLILQMSKLCFWKVLENSENVIMRWKFSLLSQVITSSKYHPQEHNVWKISYINLVTNPKQHVAVELKCASRYFNILLELLLSSVLPRWVSSGI